MEIAINTLIFLIGGYWVQQGLLVYKFWLKGVPGSGFMPVIFGAFLMMLSGFLAFKAVRKRVVGTEDAGQTKESKGSDAKYPTWIRPLVPAVYSMLSIVLMVTVGVIPTIFLTAFIWLLVVSKIRLGKSLFVSLIVTVCVYLVFVLWLRIPFPRGVFGI